MARAPATWAFGLTIRYGVLVRLALIKEASMHQIVYTSTAVEDFSYADIKHLLLGARRSNRPLGVSGMLAFHDRTFLQALEGEQRPVNEIFARIASDHRHQDIEILHRGPGFDQRLFGEWSMGFAEFTGAADMLNAFVCINGRLRIKQSSFSPPAAAKKRSGPAASVRA